MPDVENSAGMPFDGAPPCSESDPCAGCRVGHDDSRAAKEQELRERFEALKAEAAALEAATSPVEPEPGAARRVSEWLHTSGALAAEAGSHSQDVVVITNGVRLLRSDLAALSRPVGGETVTEYGVTVGHDQQAVVVSDRRALAEATFAAHRSQRHASSDNRLVQRTVVRGPWS
ncbi:hypothetical protein, partial [Mycetocola saprophilus]|uniref:hypothetical protein n=1 Tax=Mycetocola saprophilus TaxID=76636 RepID=UPI001B809015